MDTGFVDERASSGGWPQHAWLAIRQFFAVLLIIRFSVLIPLLLLATLLGSDQMSDLLRAVSEDPRRSPLLFLAAMSAFAGLTVWYAARTMLRFRFVSNPASDPTVHRRLKRLTPRVLGMAMPGMLALRTARLAWLYPNAPALWILTAVLSSVTLVVALYICTRRRLATIPALSVLAVPESQEARNLTRWSQVPTSTHRVFSALIAANGVSLVLFTSDWFYSAGIPVRLGAAAILLFAFGLMTAVGSALVYMANHYALPVLTLLAVWFCICSLGNDNHLIRTRAGGASHAILTSNTRAPLSPGVLVADGASIDTYFDGWWRDLCGGSTGDGPIPVVIVAAEGGGLRAAYWTAGVLGRLEDLTASNPMPFSRHIFAISAVSGGSVGAVLFDASLANRRRSPPSPSGSGNVTPSHLQELEGVLDNDFLSDTLGKALFSDLLQRFMPAPVFNDRAIALEQTFERRWRGTHLGALVQLSDALPSLWQQDPYRIPMLFLNSTVVETGRRALDIPLPVPKPGDLGAGQESFADVLLLRDYLGTQIPLSTAALLSARFTYVSPAGLLDTQRLNPPSSANSNVPRWRRIVDGGYFDNSGAVTAQELVRLAKQTEQRAHRNGNKRNMAIYVMHLPNAPLVDPDQTKADGGPRPVGKKLTEKDRSGWEFLSEIFAPVQALLATREARGTQAVSYLRDDSSIIVHDEQPDYVQIKAPLGWVLSAAVRDGFKTQLIRDAAADCVPKGCPGKDLRTFAASIVTIRGDAR